jgi:carboxylate-amine ligase
MPVEPRPPTTPRYQQMVERFGLTTMEQLVCGCHVHVSVESDDEAVTVLDRLRVWLPSLLALSANSPFWQGMDTGYASFRSQVMSRWPTSGPPPRLGSADAYRTLVADMVSSGVLLDEGMVYYDARVSFRYPTVEIRAADVCLDARDTALVEDRIAEVLDRGTGADRQREVLQRTGRLVDVLADAANVTSGGG